MNLPSRRFNLLLVVFFLCFPRASYGQGGPSAVSRVEIKSSRAQFASGWRPANRQSSSVSEPMDVDVVIVQQRDGFRSDDKPVDASLIAALVQALNAPPNPEVNLEDLGVTPQWQKANAHDVAQHLSESIVTGRGPLHKDALEAAFADPTRIEAVLRSRFNHRAYRCVDCSRYNYSASVEVTFEDGSRRVVRSHSEFPFMLPWSHFDGTSSADFYNAAVSRAVAALLPENAANRSRLAGDGLALELGRALFPVVEREAVIQEVENKTGPAFAALRKRYVIQLADLQDYGHTVLRKPEEKRPEQPGLFLRLRPSDLAQVFFDDELILAYKDGAAVGVDEFLRDAPKFEKLVLSVPWLADHYRASDPLHPVRPRLSFSYGATLDDATLEAFEADMQAIGRDAIIPEVAAAKDEIALFVAGSGMEESDWLVFPDRHMVLWRYFRTPIYGKPDLIKWEYSSFPTKPCTGIKQNFVGCVGMAVNPDGTLRSE